MFLELIYPALVAIGLGAFIYTLRPKGLEHLPQWYLPAMFFLKVLAGVALQVIYTYYYTDRATADIFRYFDDGMILRDIAREQPQAYLRILFGWYEEGAFEARYFDQMNSWIKPVSIPVVNDNHLMIKLHSLLAFISFGSYQFHSVIFSLLGFLGIAWTAQFSAKYFALEKWIFLAIFLFPGSLLWTSGPLKESLLIFALGGLLWYVSLSFEHLKARTIAKCTVFVLTLISLKIYFIAALVPSLVAFHLSKIFVKSRWAFVLIWFAMAGGGLLVANVIAEYDVLSVVTQKQNDFLNHSEVIASGSRVPLDRMDGSISGLIKLTPQALYNTLLAPMPWNVDSSATLPLVLENLLLWSVFLALIVRTVQRKNRVRLDGFELLIISFALPIILLIGYTTPVLGAIMRYRAPIVILLLLLAASFLTQKTKTKKA